MNLSDTTIQSRIFSNGSWEQRSPEGRRIEKAKRGTNTDKKKKEKKKNRAEKRIFIISSSVFIRPQSLP